MEWPADQVERRPLAALIPSARNARTHSDAQVAQIAASIREWGWTMPILVDEAGMIIVGHGRVLAAGRLDLDAVPVMVARGWSDAQKRAYLIADNKLGLNAGWNEELLRIEMADLMTMGFELPLIGFSERELSALNASGNPGLTDPDAAPDAPAAPVTRPGDIWTLGPHRLLCGDATSSTDVALCLGAVRPHLMVTDPPYGVAYDPKWRAYADVNKNRGKLGTVANDDRADWREAWALFPGDVAYCWHAGKHASTVQASLEAAGFEVRAQIVWAKDRFALSRGDYHWQHEPCQPAGTMVQKVVERGAGSQLDHGPAEGVVVNRDNPRLFCLVIGETGGETKTARVEKAYSPDYAGSDRRSHRNHLLRGALSGRAGESDTAGPMDAISPAIRSSRAMGGWRRSP